MVQDKFSGGNKIVVDRIQSFYELRKDKLQKIELVIYSDNDELVTKESINELDSRIKNQKGVEVIFSKIKEANHFFKDKEKELRSEIEKYLKEKTALI